MRLKQRNPTSPIAGDMASYLRPLHLLSLLVSPSSPSSTRQHVLSYVNPIVVHLSSFLKWTSPPSCEISPSPLCSHPHPPTNMRVPHRALLKRGKKACTECRQQKVEHFLRYISLLLLSD